MTVLEFDPFRRPSSMGIKCRDQTSRSRRLVHREVTGASGLCSPRTPIVSKCRGAYEAHESMQQMAEGNAISIDNGPKYPLVTVQVTVPMAASPRRWPHFRRPCARPAYHFAS